MQGSGAASALPPSRDPAPDEDPILAVLDELVRIFEERAEQPDAKLSCTELLAALGTGSHVLAILVFSLLNLLPAPPGYNFALAVVITLLSVMLLLGREIRLPAVFGRLKLPMKLVMKLVGVLSRMTGWIARVSQPRLLRLTGPRARMPIALAGIALGIGMLAPIPFTNMLPSIGLAMICIGQLNRDGLMLLAGVAIGAAGLIVLAWSVWLVIVLVFYIEDVVDGEEPEAASMPVADGR